MAGQGCQRTGWRGAAHADRPNLKQVPSPRRPLVPLRRKDTHTERIVARGRADGDNQPTPLDEGLTGAPALGMDVDWAGVELILAPDLTGGTD